MGRQAGAALHIFYTIIPMFAVIFLGWLARRKGFLPAEFLDPANRLAYYLAIPAMIFRAISKGSLTAQFNVHVLSVVLVSVILVFAAAWAAVTLFRFRHRQRGTLIQSAFHGNLGYIGLAVAYYALGTEGLARASILAGFVMILQNLLAVTVLQIYGDRGSVRSNIGTLAVKIVGNPVIVAAFSGILFSALNLPVPLVLARSLDILSGLALPMALLLIGASLSFELLRLKFFGVLFIAFMKLLVLPGVGFIFFSLTDVPAEQFLPGIILLASPAATLTYVMAREMNGDPDLAVAAISSTTLLSAATLAMWLYIAG